jgi:co-chaperonin GroES (HSP10)
MSHFDPEALDKVLPRPQGYKILVMIPKVEQTFGGVILKASSTAQNEEVLSLMGVVLDMGPEAYKDRTRFPSGEPYCKVGDCIMMRSYSGTRFKVGDTEYRLINDDSVEALVPDPKAISRVV